MDLRERSRNDWNTGEKRREKKPLLTPSPPLKRKGKEFREEAEILI
jgi:hypothetical protein